MFENTPGFEKIGEDIFAYRGFLSVSELNTIQEKIDSLSEDEWKWVAEGAMADRVSFPNPFIDFIREKIIAFLPEGYYLGAGTSFVRLFQGDEWWPHVDAHDYYPIREKAAKLKDGDPFELVENNRYGIVVYFNNFEGGEIYYPNQGIEFRQKPGDLIIHSAEENCLHGVKPVLSKIRYSHASHIYELMKVPIEN